MPVELCEGAVELCACGVACMLTGRSSTAVLSEKRAAASCARTVGSSAGASVPVSLVASFFAWYAGSTKTKLFGAAELSAAGWLAGLTSAFGAELASITRGANGDIG